MRGLDLKRVLRLERRLSGSCEDERLIAGQPTHTKGYCRGAPSSHFLAMAGAEGVVVNVDIIRYVELIFLTPTSRIFAVSRGCIK